jgi:hypothetical protein
MPSLAANPKMLKEDRRRRAFTLGQVARRLGISPDEYRELTVKDQPDDQPEPCQTSGDAGTSNITRNTTHHSAAGRTRTCDRMIISPRQACRGPAASVPTCSLTCGSTSRRYPAFPAAPRSFTGRRRDADSVLRSPAELPHELDRPLDVLDVARRSRKRRPHARERPNGLLGELPRIHVGRRGFMWLHDPA